MKTKSAIFIAILILPSLISFSQVPNQNNDIPLKKHLIGIQFDPYSDQNELFTSFVYGLRYGYNISKPITIGAELAGSFPDNLRSFGQRDVNSLTLGLYARYSILTEKRIQLFIEASPFFRYRHVAAQSFLPPLDESNLGLYVAPGVSLFSKNRKFSLDLYYKIFFPPSGIYNERSTPSFKINYHF
jgi:hypothetical protein